MRELDEELETAYEGRFSLHPARPKRGTTAHPAHDGLFGILASFTLGLGSEKGKGYVVDIKMKTLDPVPQETVDAVEDAALQFIRRRLRRAFPDADLQVEKDGPVIKIYGDLSLGKA